jgi:hypothetical protein
MLSRHQQQTNAPGFKAKADSTLPGVEKAADSTFTGVEKAINQSTALKSSKVQRRLVTPSVVLTQKQKNQISRSQC